MEVVQIPSDERGNVNLELLKQHCDETLAGLMLTNPNTLGLFDTRIVEIAALVHDAGGLLYYDGANANAILGMTRPGDMGFDVVHLNLHKTFSTPHGGGGPGAGPVGVKSTLVPFLPVPLLTEDPHGTCRFIEDQPLSIGRLKSFHGQFAVLVRAYAYIRTHGATGLRKVAETAVLNANYLKARLSTVFEIPYDRTCMHEVVLSGSRQKAQGASTLDMAKRLLDFGYHPPTIYFPLIVKEAMMIEPTETESKETLDDFADALLQIAAEVERDPESVRTAPHETAVSRLDEVKAARQAILRYKP
jgi:glycine dehydrogenase subunit 2